MRQVVAEDLLMLVSRFADDERVSGRSSYQAMKRVLREQCDVEEETVVVKRKTGGDVMQNPSDPDKGRTRTVMEASHCSACPHQDECPVRKVRDGYVLEHTPAEHRTASRRAEQATDAFRENDAIRGGGESVNAGLKRKTGMGRLRIRGSPRVRMAVLLRCAGWNLFRALTALKQRGIRDFTTLYAALAPIRPLTCRIERRSEAYMHLDRHNTAPWPQMTMLAAA